MKTPTYLQRLLNQKILLIIGIVVALAAGLLAGFTIADGQVESRVVRTYSASSTVLLQAPQPTYYQVEVPGQVQALPQPVDPAAPQPTTIEQPATPIDLSSSAIILAYIASSDAVADGVAEKVGGLETGEAITAVRRTTQPAGDEQFGGRLTLPIIDIVGVSTTPARAEEIANEATTVFGDLVAAQQVEWGVPEDIRLTLDELNAPVADEGQGSNPAIPVIVVALGVFLLFVAIALIIEAIRERRRRRNRPAPDPDAADGVEGETDAESDTETAGARAEHYDAQSSDVGDRHPETPSAAHAQVPVAAGAVTAPARGAGDTSSRGTDKPTSAAARLTRRQVRERSPKADDSAPGGSDITSS
jgi:hypothetical protein